MSRMTSADVIVALRKRYEPPEWYLSTEVANGTGYGRERARNTFADAVAINAYQSGKHGAEIHGFEVKVSRADWQHERADVGKANAVMQFCDRWWLVVPAPANKIVHDGELPATWGCLEATDDGVRQHVAAPPLHEPWALPVLPRSFVAALVRRAAEERADKEARRGATLKAPIRAVMHGGYHSGAIVLVCGHVIQSEHRNVGLKAMRCLACADGVPPAIDIVHAIVAQMSSVELRRLADTVTTRADVQDRSPWLAMGRGITPTWRSDPAVVATVRAAIESRIADAVATDAPDAVVAALAASLDALAPPSAPPSSLPAPSLLR